MQEKIDVDIYIPKEADMTTEEYVNYMEEIMFQSLEHEDETPVSIKDIDIKDLQNGK